MYIHMYVKLGAEGGAVGASLRLVTLRSVPAPRHTES